MPKEITFKTKPAIALEQLRWACVAGLPRGVVLMDAGYGAYTDLRTNITALGLSYVAGIMPQTSVWAPGTGPQPPKAWSGCGRPPKLLRRDGKHQPISVKKLAFGLPSKAWRKITWREATAEPLSSRFARVRVRAAHRDYWLAESRPEEWLLIEWPEGEEAPTKYWFSTLPANIAFPARQYRQTALAYRTRLSGTQTGGWARPLRRARLARLPPSRNAVHRGLWIPDLRAGDDSPLRNAFHQVVQRNYNSRSLPPEGVRHCGLNGTFRIRLPPFGGD